MSLDRSKDFCFMLKLANDYSIFKRIKSKHILRKLPRWILRIFRDHLQWLLCRIGFISVTSSLKYVVDKKFIDLTSHNLFSQIFPIFPAGNQLSKVAVSQLEHPVEVDAIIEEANNAMIHIVEYLGSGRVTVNIPNTDKIDWHTDQISNVRWSPNVFYKFTRTIKSSGSDIKWVRELSRGSHLIRLGQAYQMTLITNPPAADKYAEEGIQQILSWIDENPWPWGSNWQCTMDVGLRAINWLQLLDLIKDSLSLKDSRDIDTILISLYTHGKHIYSNHEKYPGGITNNHYLSNLAAQIILGVSLSFVRDSKVWLDNGLAELKLEIEKQFLPESGICFEASTGYNRLGYELLISVKLSLLAKNYSIPTWLEEAIRKMGQSIACLLKSNGEVPAFGDQDDGRVLNYYSHDLLSHKYLLGWINQEDESSISPESLWTLASVSRRELHHQNSLDSFSFQDVGWHGWRKSGWDVTIICGPLGTSGTGGHSHNDQLSFDLAVEGINFIADPGTFAYTSFPDQRNLFRSTSMHSTVSLQGIEQNSFDSLFKRGGSGRGYLKKWEARGDDEFIFKGEFIGPYVHHRSMILNSETGFILGNDKINCDPSPREMFWTLILDPDVEVLSNSANKIILKSGAISLVVELFYLERTQRAISEIIIDRVNFSKSYGVKQDTFRVRCPLENDLNLQWKVSRI
jgi:uncharacterized heparinase superfamily protein